VNTFLTERIEETLTGFAAPFVVTLYGPDLDALDRDAQAVAGVIAAVPGARDVQLQAPPGTAELSIRLRPDRLAGAGLRAAQVLQAIQSAYAGARVGQIYQGSRVVDLVVLLDPDARNRIPRLAALQLRTADGRLVRLGDVADIGVGAGRYKVLH